MKCGTRHGWDSHKARNEPPCKWCVNAVTNPAPVVKVRASRAADRKLINCGDAGGLERHRRNGTEICEPCRTAYNAHHMELKKARKARKENQ